MFKFRPNVILRFNLLVVFFFTVAGIIIIGKAAIIMFIERDDWNKIKEKNFKHDVPIESRRGNILDANGELIVSTLPKYRMLFDFVYINPHNKITEDTINEKRREIYKEHLHELCVKMNKILPGTSVAELEKRFKDGLKQGRGGFRPYKGTISFSQFEEIKKLPIINLGKTYSGFYTEELIERKNILGNTGNSTFGAARQVEIENGKKVFETTGLERMYNQYLQGKDGVGTTAKMRGRYITRIDEYPKDGMDVQTTLDNRMMDICHTALERELKAKSLAAGWAILMETKTGDIKAIVNLSRHTKNNMSVEYTDTIGKVIAKVYNKEKKDTAKYKDSPNHALSDLNEPGSIFKTVALTAMLADGKLTTKDSVPACNPDTKVHYFKAGKGRHKVKDTMHRDNGTGKYSMSDAMMYSSNISFVHFIRKAYLDNPEEYINTLKRFGITQNYRLTPEEATPYLTLPGTPSWNAISLHSMSYGYAVAMTAINMVTFYNTIANGGRQMHPRLVKAILDNGTVVKNFPTKVINEQLFPRAVADTITGMLVKVVNGKSIIVDKKDWRHDKYDGTGNQARSEMMTIAGKTGTAVSNKDENDKLMSFCGFFPAEEPEYTLIVQMFYDDQFDTRTKEEKRKNGYGGGSTSALVFKEIAEKVMAERFSTPIEEIIDKKRQEVPVIKLGNINEANYLLMNIGLQDTMPQGKNKEFGEIKYKKNGKKEISTKEYGLEKIPDVKGMGAKDATYLLQQCGLNVKLTGYGTVWQQSIAAGKKAVKGGTIELKLKP